jgi:hydroxyquinol 1,2-dioxygenase
MRDVRVDTITAATQKSWETAENPRLKQLLTELMPYLHCYIRDVQLTHAEWLACIEFLHRAGAVSTDTRNEFSLLSDVLGVTSLVDLQNAAPGATVGSVLGPFYVENSPALPLGGDLVKDNAGDVILLTGTVRDVSGAPLAGATIDMWQADARGQYAVYDASQHPENLRCLQTCDANGRYWFTTVLPAPYSIPMDGPVGHLFTTVGRSEWRPGHYHFIIRAAGHRPIVTEVFFAGGTHVDNDAVFGVREPLVVQVEPVTAATVLPQPLARQPDKLIRFDFKLVADVTA